MLVEVALVQLTTAPPAGADDIGALAARVAKLEQALRPAGRPPAAAPVDPATGRTALGGRARRAAPPTSPVAERPLQCRRRRRQPTLAADTATGSSSSATLRGMARPLYTAVDVVAIDGDAVTMVGAERPPPGQVRAAPRRGRGGVAGRHRAAGDDRAHRRRQGRRRAPKAAPPPDDDDIDLDDLVDAAPGTVDASTASPRRSPAPSWSSGTTDVASAYSPPVQTLIDELGRLPGIGPKSAQRIAFHLLKIPADDVARLATAISDAKAKVRFCGRCFNVTDTELCSFCTDDRRDARIVCVVEESRDIVAVERTGEFHGRYHVLLGAMSPLEGIGPEQLKIRELLARIEPEGIEEIVLCTNPNTEGEVTAMYLARQLRPLGLQGHPPGQRPPGRRRPRVRRRTDPRPSPGGPARGPAGRP